MKTFDFNTTNQSKRNKTRIIILLVLFVLSSMGVFGQNVKIESNTNSIDFKIENTSLETKKDITTIESQIDFMGWFMGSKYNQNNSNNGSDVNKSSSSTKKQILSSGIEPNRVLYRTFVKKVMNKDNALA